MTQKSASEMNFEKGASIFVFVVALITFLLSTVVVGHETYQYFYYVTNKIKLFPRMISWIAFCEMIGSLIMLIGILTRSSQVCAIQSGLFQFFNRLSWNWTLMLTLQLDRVIVRKLVPIKEWQMHIATLAFALFFEVVPFFVRDVKYGSDDASTHLEDAGAGGVDFKFICTGFTGNQTLVDQMTSAVFTGYLVGIIVLLLMMNYRLYHFLNVTKN